MEKPPKHIFYDFACQLSEYCLNREPEFFRNTQFWHDLFHSIGHLCGFNFKSGRVVGLEGINSEICEQVNSFLQCIKYTSSHVNYVSLHRISTNTVISLYGIRILPYVRI